MKRTLPKNPRVVDQAVEKPPALPAKWMGYYRQLIKLRERLTADQRGLVREAAGEATAGMHIADSASDRFEQSLASALLTSERNALLEIEEALGRIRSGTYGVCELSGSRIPAARLRAIPWTRFGAEAEQRMEAKIRPSALELPQEKNSGRTNSRHPAQRKQSKSKRTQ